MEEEYQLEEHVTSIEESLELIKYGLPVTSANFVRFKNKEPYYGLRYIDKDKDTKEMLSTMTFNEVSDYIPCWDTGRLLELFVLGFSTDYYITYDRNLNLKDEVYAELLDGLKAGRGNFSAEALNYKIPELPKE